MSSYTGITNKVLNKCRSVMNFCLAENKYNDMQDLHKTDRIYTLSVIKWNGALLNIATISWLNIHEKWSCELCQWEQRNKCTVKMKNQQFPLLVLHSSKCKILM